MRRALTSAAKALVAAGALGLVSPVLAQSTQALVKTSPAAPLVKPQAATTSPEATDEMQVELAWLESPLTFHLDLVAHVANHALEVSGSVPSQDVKETALNLARRRISLPISDLVTINPSSVSPVSKVPVDVMTERVRQALADVSNQIIGLKIMARDDGQVIIRGVVKSLEGKLTVSRKLRKVDGCSAAANQLLLPFAPHDEVPTTTTAKPTSTPDKPDTTQQANFHQSSAAVDKNIRRPYVTAGAVVLNDSSIEKPSGAARNSVTGSINDSYQGSIPAALKDKNIRLPYVGSGAVTINDGSIQSQSLPAPVIVMTPPATTSQPPLATKVAVKPVDTSIENQASPAPVMLTKLGATTSQPPLATKVAVKPVDTSIENQPSPAPVMVTKPATTTSQPPLSTKVVVKPAQIPETETTKASASIPAEAIPLEKIDHASYVATGTVAFDDDLEEPAPPTTKSPHAAKLKSQVEALCGKSAKVDVTVKPDNTIHVKVSVKDAKTQTSLADKILLMPEMAMPDIRLEMEVAK